MGPSTGHCSRAMDFGATVRRYILYSSILIVAEVLNLMFSRKVKLMTCVLHQGNFENLLEIFTYELEFVGICLCFKYL